MSILDRMIKMFASVKLAVFVILSLAVISAVGTIYEAKYDAEVAQKLVYQSPYMYATLGLLCLTLIAVMIDRWPWKQHHAGFVLAHIGIIILLIGSWLTQKYGIDGSMAFEIGQESRQITVRDRDLMVFASFDGGGMQNIYESPVDFLRHPPSDKRPFVVNLGGDELRFIEYRHFAFRESEIVPAQGERDGPAIRFQLENPNVNVTEWLRRDGGRPPGELDLGPAKVILTSAAVQPSGRNEIMLIARPGRADLEFRIYGKDKILRKKGILRESETLETGWMGLKFRLLRYLPRAREEIHYTPSASASPMATSAVKFIFRGQEYWLGLNSALRLYLEDKMYVVSYGHRRIELAFPLRLREFRVGKYEGTERAASYESQVDVPERGEVLISMNEPLKYGGFTFYQASFEKDERGKPTMSILSVNHDPGRWFKYLGCFLIVFGSIVLFYFKRVQWLKKGTAV